MAKINFGGVVQDARGKQNGIVYSKNKSGPYIRRKVTPVNPGTVAQTNVRSTFGTLSQNWSSVLADADRAAWTAFATLYPIRNVFGLSIPLNGLNYYIAINAALTNAGMAPITDPPASPATTPIPVETTSLTVDSTTQTIAFDQEFAGGAAGAVFYLFGTPQLAPGRASSQSLYRFVGIHVQGTGSFPAQIDISTGYIFKFGALRAGLRTNILVSTINPTVGVPTVGQLLTAIST